MKRNLRLVLLVVGLLLVVPLSAGAQEDDAQAFVIGAFENFMALESYSFTIETQLRQDITSGEGLGAITIEQGINQQGRGRVRITSAQASDTAMTLDQTAVATVGSQTVEIVMSMDMVVVDDTLYVRFFDVSDELVSTLPEGWFNLSEGTQGYEGLAFINPEGMADLANTIMLYPINDDTIRELNEIDGETIDGVEVRVFEMTLDAQTVFATAGDALTALFDAEALGIDPEVIIDQMGENTTLEFTLYIGAADQQLYRFASTATTLLTLDADILGVPVTIDQTAEGLTTLSDFNAPVRIKVPEVERDYQ